MQNKRIILIGGVGLVKGSLRGIGKFMLEVCNDFEPVLQEYKFTESAPFHTISIIIRVGERSDFDPEYGSVNRRSDEIPVSVQIDMKELHEIAMDKGKMRQLVADIAINILYDIAKKYSLPIEALSKLRK